ncbi:histidine phosphatase family protein [Mucilaginibacter sp. RS28]|uniref:Multiple inositol polyphosphate phosphatase 1 n=1 Tax=Mucilaginibacter straminoryzae TaxID=2932774 RepID=A0A9X1X0S7_9SPHI|nr:histidine-type phosphatase [Mucilaginibacter straminoryzae]MCJ8209049.1 histidine phosphatase family protein [Mucilaginibacter straminoryzae]
MDKKYLTFLIFILGSLAFNATAQNCNVAYLGTKTLYKAPSAKASAAPAGYKAVFINHVGRHGARHLTKEVSTSFSYGFLNNADSAGQLTTEGTRLWAMVKKLDKVEHKHVKSISAEGVAELNGLGDRMYQNYQAVFKGPVKLSVAITKEVRTKQSADAFLAGMKKNLKDSATVEEYPDDLHLRFYDLSPAYTSFEESAPSNGELVRLKQQLQVEKIEEQIAAKWLKDISVLKTATVAKLVSDVFGFASIVPSLKQEITEAGFKPGDLNFESFFTCKEIQVLGKIDAAEDYYLKGPGVDNNGLQVRIAAPLLADFIKSTDAWLAKPEYTARLRFAHAETIAPFAALLEMSTANKATPKGQDFEQNWQAGQVIPLSSNIQWVIYSNGKGSHLVKFLLNEKEVSISGLKPVKAGYYDWKLVRSFYLAKLQHLGLGMDSDMLQYLKELK